MDYKQDTSTALKLAGRYVILLDKIEVLLVNRGNKGELGGSRCTDQLGRRWRQEWLVGGAEGGAVGLHSPAGGAGEGGEDVVHVGAGGEREVPVLPEPGQHAASDGAPVPLPHCRALSPRRTAHTVPTSPESP